MQEVGSSCEVRVGFPKVTWMSTADLGFLEC